MKCFLILVFMSCQTEAVFQVMDRAFHVGSGFVDLVPFVGPPRNTWIGTKIFLWINVNHSAAGRGGTWVVTLTDPMIGSGRRGFFPDNFWADEFVSGDAAFKLTGSFVFHWERGVLWTTGNPILINRIVKVFKMCPGVQRNIGFLEVPARPKGITGKKFLVQADRIKGGITKEGVRPYQRMRSKKVLKGRNQEPCVMDGFVLIRRIGFLINGNFGMLLKESFVVEIDVPDDTEAVCNNPDFIGVAEMPVDIERLDFGIDRRMGRHGSIGSFVWIIGIVKAFGFGISF